MPTDGSQWSERIPTPMTVTERIDVSPAGPVLEPGSHSHKRGESALEEEYRPNYLRWRSQ